MKCPKCGGKGYLEFESGTIRIICPVCKGTGVVDDKPKRKKRTRKDRNKQSS